MSPNPIAVPLVPGSGLETAASSQDAAGRRTRSRTGCYTCRRRKKACDGHRPVCNACCRLEIPCVFPRPDQRKKSQSTSTSRQNNVNPLQSPVISDGLMLGANDGSQVDGNNDADGQIDWTSIDDIFGLSNAGPPHGGDSPFDWTLLVPESVADDLIGSRSADDATTLVVDVPPMSSNIKAHCAASVGNDQTTGLSYHTQEQNDAIILNPAPLAPSLQGLPTGVTSSAPLLLDYFINTFSSIISVLGPQENVLLRHLLPLASSSPIIMCGVIGWSASHLATIGQPFAGIAQANTSAMEIQVDSLAGELSHDKSMEAMLTILMIGGAEICRGDVRGWNQRLTTARRLLLAAQERSSGRLSNEWLGIACNTIYHDVLSAVATKKDLYVPVDQYRKILDPMLEPDTYMGAGMQIFSALGDIVNLAAKASAVQGGVELLDVIAEAKRIQTRLDGMIPPRECCNLDRLHLVHAFQAYRSTAQLLVRQIVLRSAPCDLETRMLVQRTMSGLRLVLDTSSETQMLLPVFVLGVDTVGKVGRTEVTALLDRFNSRVMMGNIKSVHQLLVKVWARNEDGDRWVDWRALADEVSRVYLVVLERQSDEQEDCAISFG